MQALDAGTRRHHGLGAFAAGAVAALLLALAAIVPAAYAVLYLTPHYMESEYERYDVLSSLPEMSMSEEDGLMAVTNHMMDYLLTGDEPEELQIEVVMGGELRGFFSERELLHMWDVRRIFRAFILSSAAAALLAAALILLAGGDRRHLGAGIMAGTGTGVIASALLLVLGGDSFSELFVNFHLLMFDNDLWLLDPREDMLINIVPEGFFYDTFVRIALVWILLMAALGVSGAVLWRRHSHKNDI